MMKRIIELSENDYKALKEDGVQNHLALADTIITYSIPYEERPQGEWIRTGSLGNGNAQYECSNCHYGDEQAESQEVPYCWHCGAKMRKGGVEND